MAQEAGRRRKDRVGAVEAGRGEAQVQVPVHHVAVGIGPEPDRRAQPVQRRRHIVAAVGLSDGHTNFRKVFGNMGIEDRWILTPGASKSDIRSAFRVISQTAVRTSQGRGQFSRAAAGGFGAP